MKGLQIQHIVCTALIALVLMGLGGATVYASAEQQSERSGFFSSLRERQIENRRELQEKITPSQEEVQRAVRENVRDAIYDFVIANERLASAAQSIIQRRNTLFQAGYPTDDLDALLRESIDMILDNHDALRGIYADIQAERITTRQQLSNALIDVRGEILATQDLLSETWALLRGDVE